MLERLPWLAAYILTTFLVTLVVYLAIDRPFETVRRACVRHGLQSVFASSKGVPNLGRGGH